MCVEVADEYADKLTAGFAPTGAGLFLQPLVQPVVNSMKNGLAGVIAQKMEDMALKKVSKAAGVDQELLHSFWTADFVVVLQGDMVCDVLMYHAKNAVDTLYTKIKYLFALLMLPLLLETGFALYRRKKVAA